MLAAAVPGPRRSPRPKQACTEAALLGGGSRLVYGGAGNKILAAAIGDVDAVIQVGLGLGFRLGLGLWLGLGLARLSDSLAMPGCTCEAEAGSAPG